jgi:hypothetical protein
MEGDTTLVGRGSGITESFERSRLFMLTSGSRDLRTADLSDIASEASATPLLQEAKSEPLCVLPSARNDSAARSGLAIMVRARSIALLTYHGWGERSAAPPALHLSPFTFHLSRSLA